MLALWNDCRGMNRRRSSLDGMRREMDRLFYDFDRGFFSNRPRGWSSGPTFKLTESDEELVIKGELPGVAKKDLEITLDRGTLTIRGERKDEPPEGYAAVRRERRSLRFSHSYRLPVHVDSGKAEAKLEDGVLVLTLPRAEESKARQIPVATA
jgi:HSP20 family protein